MIKTEFQVKLIKNWAQGTLDMYAFKEAKEGRYIVQPSKMKIEFEKEGIISDPFLRFHPDIGKSFLQSLVNECAENGIIANRTLPPREEIQAIKYHLEDMRKLVFQENQKTPDKFGD